jgi:predicted lipase
MIPPRHTSLIHLASKYANDAYSKSIHGKFIESIETDTKSFVSFINGDVIICGQGTTSIKDISIDCQIWRTKVNYLENTKVHSGFMKSYESIRHLLHKEIKNILSTYEVTRIIVTGHSLFGAIATICALDCSLIYNIPVNCITFGSPRVGCKKFAKCFNKMVEISYRCVRLKDPVTFTPLPLRFKHVRGGIHFGKSFGIIGSESLSLYNCCGCRINHHSMQEYHDFTCEMNKLSINIT